MDISVQLLVDTRETREEVISKQYPSGWIFPINLPVKVQSVIFFDVLWPGLYHAILWITKIIEF